MRLIPAALAAAILSLAATAPVADAAGPSVQLEFLGRHASNAGLDKGGAEIPAHDPRTQRVFVVNLKDRAIDVLDIRNPQAPVKLGAIDISLLGQAANSVDVRDGVLAVAIEAAVKTSPGLVALYDTRTLQLLRTYSVGALPDMLKFTPNGRYLVVANEGEPDSYLDGNVDPEGSVSIIEWRKADAVARTVGFASYNSRAAELRAAGVRLFGPRASVAQDLEPEYIAISTDSRTAYVTLQENNAIASIDLTTARVNSIRALGSKNHALPGNGLDPSDRDNAIAINSWPLQGLYMPDSIALFSAQNRQWLITANEGDARDYAGFAEEASVSSLALDPVAFPDAAALKTSAQLGRLNVTRTLGDSDGDGDYDALYSFGARSFSIWDTRINQVYDSGDDFEQITAAEYPANFNANSTGNARDNRSDNKGPEPEGLAIGKVRGRTYAFIGLERIGGIMVYDITNPAAPDFVQYLNMRNFAIDPNLDLAGAGELAPEGLIFIKADDSPIGEPLLVVASEVSGTTAIYRLATVQP